jgi:hypothetical protein
LFIAFIVAGVLYAILSRVFPTGERRPTSAVSVRA